MFYAHNKFLLSKKIILFEGLTDRSFLTIIGTSNPGDWLSFFALSVTSKINVKQEGLSVAPPK